MLNDDMNYHAAVIQIPKSTTGDGAKHAESKSNLMTFGVMTLTNERVHVEVSRNQPLNCPGVAYVVLLSC